MPPDVAPRPADPVLIEGACWHAEGWPCRPRRQPCVAVNSAAQGSSSALAGAGEVPERRWGSKASSLGWRLTLQRCCRGAEADGEVDSRRRLAGGWIGRRTHGTMEAWGVREIELTLRYCNFYAVEDEQTQEELIRREEMRCRIPIEQSALVLVDVWDCHYIQTHQARAEEIIRERIVPLLDAARSAGLRVVHAPAKPAATKYPQWTQFAADEDLFGPRGAPEPWPPAEFVRREGDYSQYAKPKARGKLRETIQRTQRERDIHPAVRPQPGDFVIATGPQLHRLCRFFRILHLFYAGFAANMCVLDRDYGIRAMARRGYNCILLRDCTTAIEADETVGKLELTEAAIWDVEMLRGFSTTSEHLIAALNAVR